MPASPPALRAPTWWCAPPSHPTQSAPPFPPLNTGGSCIRCFDDATSPAVTQLPLLASLLPIHLHLQQGGTPPYARRTCLPSRSLTRPPCGHLAESAGRGCRSTTAPSFLTCESRAWRRRRIPRGPPPQPAPPSSTLCQRQRRRTRGTRGHRRGRLPTSSWTHPRYTWGGSSTR